MNKYHIGFVYLANIFVLLTATKTYIEGYYWRDYEGIIPSDALPGGLAQNGKPIYIGQLLVDTRLVPAKIYENDPNVYYEWGMKEVKATKNAKILCSQNPEDFEWLPTKHDELVLLTNKVLIKGGHEAGYSTYIGRVYSAGETTVGKVICQETDCLGLYFTRDGKATQHRGAFEVLSYKVNCNATNIDRNILIDVRSP